MNIKKYLLTDADGVLLDWHSAFRSWAKSKSLPITDKPPTTWDMDNYVPGYNIDELIEEFSLSEYYRNIAPYPGAVNTLLNLHKEHNFEIVIITACLSNPISQESRLSNLKTHFGRCNPKIHLVPLGVSKFDMLTTYPISIWLDDRIENVEDGEKAGHISVLVDQSYNREDNRLTRMCTWEDLHSHVERLEKNLHRRLIDAKLKKES